jgi:hypothetical protein
MLKFFSKNHHSKSSGIKDLVLPLGNYQKKNTNEKICLIQDLSYKKIVHVLDHSNGFGDFLRGTIFLFQIKRKYNINLDINVLNHSINKYLDIENLENVPTGLKVHSFLYGITGEDFKKNFYNFINSTDETFYVTTNLFYDTNLITNELKNELNSFFKFKPKYYEIANNLVKIVNYNVLHIRCRDEYFDKEFNSFLLLAAIVKLNLKKNTIVISNNSYIKKK